MKFVIGAYLSLALITVLAVRSTAGGSSQSWCWLPRAGQWVHSSKFAAFHSQYEVHGTDLWVSSGGSAAPTVLKDVCRPSGRGQGHPVPAPKEAQDSLKAAILEKGSKFQFLSTRSGLNYAIVTNGCITKGGQVALFYPQGSDPPVPSDWKKSMPEQYNGFDFWDLAGKQFRTSDPQATSMLNSAGWTEDKNMWFYRNGQNWNIYHIHESLAHYTALPAVMPGPTLADTSKVHTTPSSLEGTIPFELMPSFVVGMDSKSGNMVETLANLHVASQFDLVSMRNMFSALKARGDLICAPRLMLSGRMLSGEMGGLFVNSISHRLFQRYVQSSLALPKFEIPVLKRGHRFKAIFIHRMQNRQLRNQAELVRRIEAVMPITFQWKPQAITPSLNAEMLQITEFTSAKEQFAWFNEADIVIGVHGAGLTMAAYMAPHSAMIELYPWGWHMSCYMYLAATCDLYHASVLGALPNDDYGKDRPLKCAPKSPWANVHWTDRCWDTKHSHLKVNFEQLEHALQGAIAHMTVNKYGRQRQASWRSWLFETPDRVKELYPAGK